MSVKIGNSNNKISSEIKLASQIIDFFNGKHDFLIENPYFDVKGIKKIKKENFLEYKTLKNNGSKLESPKIYYNFNGNWTREFKIVLFNRGKRCNVFEEYGGPTSKIIIRPLISLGSYQENDLDIQTILLFDKQLNLAIEFAILMKLFDPLIEDNETDKSFIEKIINSFNNYGKGNEKEMKELKKIREELDDIKDEILDKISSLEPNAYTKNNEEQFGPLDYFKDSIKKYYKLVGEDFKNNPVIKFFVKSDNINSAIPSILIVNSKIKGKENEKTEVKFVNFKPKFKCLNADSSNSEYVTQIKTKTGLEDLSRKIYDSLIVGNKNVLINFSSELEFRIEKYSNVTISTSYELKQVLLKEVKRNKDNRSDFSDDSDEEEFNTTFE